MSKRGRVFAFLICLNLTVFAQTKEDIRSLEPGQLLEREIVGAQTHAYRIHLSPGQFIRILVDQTGINLGLGLVTPNDDAAKPSVQVNLTGVGDQESLSFEAMTSGEHRLLIRTTGGSILNGSYQLKMERRDTATPLDKKRIAAERLLNEAALLSGRGPTAQQAIEKADEAMKLWRELNDPLGEAKSSFVIAEANRLLSQYGKSIEFAEKALAIYVQAKNRAGELGVNITLGIAISISGRLEQGAERFERALALARELKDRDLEGRLLANLGTSNNLMDRLDRAVDYLNRAVALAREMKNPAAEKNALHNLGESNIKLARYEQALKYFEQALVLHRELKDRFAEGTTLASMGETYRSLGRPDQAIECHEQALAIRREQKDRNGEAQSLSVIGLAYIEIGRYEKSIEYGEKSLAIRREVKNRLGETSSLLSLANAWYYLNHYDKAIECYEQALAISREAKYRLQEGLALHNLGNIYNELARYDKAADFYSQGLAIYQELKNRANEGNAYSNLGNVAVALRQPEKAIAYFQQSVAIFRETKSRSDEARALNNLGNGYIESGQKEKAKEIYTQALAIRREVKDRRGEGLTLYNLGRAHYALEQYDKAADYYALSVEVLRETGIQHETARSLVGLAAAERQLGLLDRARAHIEQSLAITESLRSDILSPESRASYFAPAQEGIQFYIDLLMRLHRSAPEKGFDALAFEASERMRARSLLELLAESRADIRQGADAALLENERALARQLNARSQLLSQAKTPAQATAIKQEISRLETDYEQAQAAIRKNSPRYAELTRPEPLKLNQIQRELEPDTLLLQYALGAERSFLWAITQNSIASYELPGQERINELSMKVYQSLTARGRAIKGETEQMRRRRAERSDAQLTDATQELSAMLLSPVADQLGNKRLVIIPDGALQYLPFAMLPEPEKGRRGEESVIRNPQSAIRNPLIVNHEVINLPSASTLAAQRIALAGRPAAPKTLAVIADPVFTANDQRVRPIKVSVPAQKSSADGNPQTEATIASVEQTRIIEHLAEESTAGAARKLVIPRLPFTRREADQIARIATEAAGSSGAPGSTDDQILKSVDFKANRAIVSAPELRQYRYIHFATHGLLDSERPGLSALVLSLVDEEGKPQDGFLRAHEIYNLSLSADLVVLSACQTGLGKEIKGEGLVGLSRGFMYAGAARVLVSLWNVNDRATAELMTTLYQKMLKEGQRPAAALRAAQVEMWKRSRWRSPYYWAAFTLQGEWR
jgi:CHAT domain-containing protein/uncharacterized protein HemY